MKYKKDMSVNVLQV